MYTLLLRLGGPLQSWGSESLFDTRDTDYFPTKSGVIGMIASALGRKRDANIDDLSELQFGVRIDHQGEMIIDYQVTDMGEKLNANISRRGYLSDALFLVGLSSNNRELLQEIKLAVNNPKYPLFLGRRSCPPTLPLDLGIKEEALYQALLNEEWLFPEWRRAKIFRNRDIVYLRIIIDDPIGGALKKDSPKSYSPFHREYEYRKISEKKPKIISNPKGISFTQHDAMKELG